MKKIATLAGALAGPAGGGISSALNMALPGESCSPQSLIGYQHDYVHQADAMVALYFDIHKNNRQGLATLIKKLQFNQLATNLHPDLRFNLKKNQNASRLRRVNKTQFRYFNDGGHFVLNRNNKPPVQLKLKYQQIFEDENKVFIYVDEKALLQLNKVKDGKVIMWLSIADKTGTHRFEHQEDLLTEDMWGAHLAFSAPSDKKKEFFEDTGKIVLTVAPAEGPSDRRNSEPIRSHTFVPGKVEW
jgi:hypothetical protein